MLAGSGSWAPRTATRAYLPPWCEPAASACGPAAADGRIRKGDVLVAVDGMDVRKLHTAQVTPLIYGKRGSSVTPGFVRADSGSFFPSCSRFSRMMASPTADAQNLKQVQDWVQKKKSLGSHHTLLRQDPASPASGRRSVVFQALLFRDACHV